MKPLCIYHSNCADGFGAAWVVRKYFGADGVDFHPGTYGQEPPDVTGRDVIIVDFSYKRPVIDAMSAKARTILILDHHKTAKEDLDAFSWASGVYSPEGMMIYQQGIGAPVAVHAVFDMERSGAGLTWDFFFAGRSRPKLIDHIEDRDLWRFVIYGTREIQATIFSYPYDFDIWDKLVDANPHELIGEGRAIERKHFKDVAELTGITQRRMVIGGVSIPVANMPYTLVSDAANAMAAADPTTRMAACYWDTPEGRVFGIRSTNDGPDVSAIARQYGGGGHAHAAGFKMPRNWEGDAP